MMPREWKSGGKPRVWRRAAQIGIFSALLILLCGCSRTETVNVAQPLERETRDFAIYWPIQDPEEPLPPSAKPLLRGTLSLAASESSQSVTPVRLTIRIARPCEEADREYWNSALAFSHIRWMEEVRVWDADDKWLWPNLAYLLRLPGEERVERYGGMDPGKQVDNDFAAVLIRKYDASGAAESKKSRDAPLVSAEWHPVGQDNADLHSIVHEAVSDEFLLHLGEPGKPERGRLKVWLVYADFFNARVPVTWPKTKEFAGGILAYFEIDWEALPEGGCRCTVRQMRPEEGTRFPWADWVVREPGADRSQAEVRLSDVGG